jgi:hypothetical protein
MEAAGSPADWLLRALRVMMSAAREFAICCGARRLRSAPPGVVGCLLVVAI